MKSEGDVVQIGDLIMLESLKSIGQYLHCSATAHRDATIYKAAYVIYNYALQNIFNFSHELNLSVIHSGFSVHRLTKASEMTEPLTVRAGSIVQLFHKEMEAYLAAEGVFGGHVSDNGELSDCHSHHDVFFKCICGVDHSVHQTNGTWSHLRRQLLDGVSRRNRRLLMHRRLCGMNRFDFM